MPALSQSIEIHARPEQVEAIYCDFEKYPEFINSVQEVRARDGLLDCHLRVVGIDIPYTARVEKQGPGEYRWETVEGRIMHRGTVQIQPAESGTRLSIHVDYDMPGGALGQLTGKIVNWTGLVESGLQYSLECARAYVEAQ
jgi:uncharacterized membrane protein